MSKLYNPELVPKEEIKRTFVGRHKLIEEIISIIEKQPEGAGIQHLIIVAPRGMGKTTLLLMLRFAIEDGELSKRWQPIQFPEESYDIYELSDFWIKVAKYLAEETGDENLSKKIAEIKNEFTKNEDLYEVAFALLKDWRRKHNKQFVLLIDNFDMILEQINSELDAARLRKELMNDDTVMLIGSAVTFFQEIRGYEHPLYNFFKIYNLEGFKTELIEEFLKRRAEEEGIKNFEGILRKNRAKIKTLAYFTDGNPRLVLMLFDVITKSKVNDVEKALESLLDEVTPYFKAKIELLPAQQRKILDYIARMSFEKREGVTPTEISAEVRLTPNQTSSQLKRLAEDGYVKAANISGRSSFYLLSEPLVAIWYQMRFGRTAYQKRRWLIFVLKGLYELEELRREQTKLRREYKKSLDSGQTDKARDILKHQLYLAEAMPEFSGAKVHFEHFVSQSLILKNESTLKEELRNPDLLKRLSAEMLDNLQKEGWITENQCSKAKADATARELSKKENDSFAELLSGRKILQEISPENRQKQLEKALKHFDRAIELDPTNLSALFARGSFFNQFGKFREAISDLDKAIMICDELVNKQGRSELANDLAGAYMNKGAPLDNLGKLNEAIGEYDKAIAIYEALVNEQGRSEEANNLAGAYMNKGVSLDRLGRLNEAIEEYDKAIATRDELVNKQERSELVNDLALTYLNKGATIYHLGKLNEAIEEYNKTIVIYDELVNKQGRSELVNDLGIAYMNKGVVLDDLGKLNEAIGEYDKAIAIYEALVNEQGRSEEANNLAGAYINKGVALDNLGKLNEAIAENDKAIRIRKDLVENQGRTELANDLAMAYINKGVTLNSLGKSNEAIEEYDKAIKLFDDSKEINQNWEILINRSKAFLNKTEVFINRKEFSKASEYLQEAIESLDAIKYESLNSYIFNLIFSTAEGDDFSSVRKLLNSEELEKRFFPVLRAIDYLETKDEALIEKLSPEVRGIVEEAVRALSRESAEDSASAPDEEIKKRKRK